MRLLQSSWSRKEGPIWAWLVLAAIFVHALLPVGSAILRSSGSPFSATTVEVSVAPKRHSAPIEAEQLRDDDGDRLGTTAMDLAPVQAEAYRPARPSDRASHAAARVPELSGAAWRGHRARAPPLA